jgi:hypothetical protein
MSRLPPADSALFLLALFAAFLLVVPLSTGAVAQESGDALGEGETVFVLELDTDGDAHWQIIERIPLADGEAEAAFLTVAEEFEAGEYDLETYDRVETAVSAVDESTGREMAVTDPDRTSTIAGDQNNRTGTLTVSFTWENFARMSGTGDDLYIDDVLTTEQGLWLDRLAPDQTLVLRAPDGYAVLDASVPPEGGSLRWEGPTEFDPETLMATFVGNGNGTDDEPDGQNGTDDEPDGTDDSSDSSFGLLWLVLGGVAIAAVAAVLLLYREHLGDLFERDPGPEGDESATDGGAQTDPGHTEAVTTPDEPPPVGETAASGTATDDGIDEELLSDEERVERLLERNGGRMKQADIVDETGWSNAKVSQLLSSMAEQDRIDKLRIGRENLISFPDVDVTDPDSDS